MKSHNDDGVPSGALIRTVVLSQSDPRNGPYGIDILPHFGYAVSGVSPLRVGWRGSFATSSSAGRVS